MDRRGSKRVKGKTPRNEARFRVQGLVQAAKPADSRGDAEREIHRCRPPSDWMSRQSSVEAFPWRRSVCPCKVQFEASRGPNGFLGIDVMDDETVGALNIVVAIIPGSVAAEEGLFQLGDEIVTINGQKVPRDGMGVESLIKLLPASVSYVFGVLRAGGLTDEVRRAARKNHELSGLSPPLLACWSIMAAAVSARDDGAESNGCHPDLEASGPTTPRHVLFARAAAVQQASQELGLVNRSSP